jgi:hypothetical protein
MAGCGETNSGGKFYISTTAQNEDLTLAEFQALVYIEVPNLGNLGDTGITQNIVSYELWGRSTTCKGKGIATANDVDAEFLDVDSPGMDAMEAAASSINQNNYPFKIEWPSGSAEYNRGLVTGPTLLKGGNEDFKRVSFSLGLQQAAVRVPAAP